MSEQSHADEIAWEQAVNERYLKQAKRQDEPNPLVEKHATTTPGAKMHDKAPIAPKVGGPIGPLIGRVALSPHDENLGQSFYIGHRYTVLRDAKVINWAAAASSLFFQGRSAAVSSADMVQPRTIAARRTFKRQRERIADFEDDCESGVDPCSAFRRPSSLEIPLPPAPLVSSGPGRQGASKDEQVRPAGERPARRDRPRLDDEQPSGDSGGKGEVPQGAPVLAASTEHPRAFDCAALDDPTDAESSDLVDSRPLRVHGEAGAAPPGASGPETPDADDSDNEGLGERRARRLLYKAIKAPKTGELAPVLSTLQAEQYRLVTWPHDENLVVQGHPGTGKTIIAAHRAAYLVLPKDSDDETPRLHKVALVGPTDRWKRHIQPTVMGLVEEGVEVLSLEELVRTWAPRGSAQALHPTDEGELQSLWAIGRVVDRAATAHQQLLCQYKPARRVRELVNRLVQDTETHHKYVGSERKDLAAWLLAAESYERARRNPSYLLFLATVAIAVAGTGQHSGLHHIVVDEAQDIRPIEWWMLSRTFRAGHEARWSLFGDMNQRRSDFTWESWEKLADRLELSSTDSMTLVPEVLECGYRSTREILDYAGALLPRGMRRHNSLRSGPEPSIPPRVGPKQLVGEAVEAAERLTVRYHQGSVAVIAWDQGKVQQIERMLLKQGWRRDTGGGRWLQRPHRVCRLGIIRPAEARGLEFDAVVVAEPADFKPNLGRHGELYTSLTRANQELVVIHSKAMPRELSGRGNRVRG